MKYQKMLFFYDIVAGVGWASPTVCHGQRSRSYTTTARRIRSGYKRTSCLRFKSPRDVKLVDSNGKPVSLRRSLAGDNPVMLNFIFTTATTILPGDECDFFHGAGKTRTGAWQGAPGSISIDPEHDAPSRLNAYAKKFGAGAQWRMLTGSVEDQHCRATRFWRLFWRQGLNHGR